MGKNNLLRLEMGESMDSKNRGDTFVGVTTLYTEPHTEASSVKSGKDSVSELSQARELEKLNSRSLKAASGVSSVASLEDVEVKRASLLRLEVLESDRMLLNDKMRCGAGGKASLTDFALFKLRGGDRVNKLASSDLVEVKGDGCMTRWTWAKLKERTDED